MSWLPLWLCTWHISNSGISNWAAGNSLTWQLVFQKVLQPGAQVQQDLDGGSQTVGHIREESSKDLTWLHHSTKDRRKAFNSWVALENKAFKTNGQTVFFLRTFNLPSCPDHLNSSETGRFAGISETYIFTRSHRKVTKERMCLKTSAASAATGALLFFTLLGLHGRASLHSCSSRAGRDHKARAGHLWHCMPLLRRSVAFRVCSDHVARWQCLTRSKPLALRMVQTIHCRHGGHVGRPTISCVRWPCHVSSIHCHWLRHHVRSTRHGPSLDRSGRHLVFHAGYQVLCYSVSFCTQRLSFDTAWASVIMDSVSISIWYSRVKDGATPKMWFSKRLWKTNAFKETFIYRKFDQHIRKQIYNATHIILKNIFKPIYADISLWPYSL